MEFENKEQVAVFIERHLKELGGEAYGLPYIAEKLWQWHEQQVKSVDLSDVGEMFDEYTTQVGVNICTSCGSDYCDGNICT